MYERDEFNNILQGSVEDLKDYVNDGAELKVLTPEGLHTVQKVSIGTLEGLVSFVIT